MAVDCRNGPVPEQNRGRILRVFQRIRGVAMPFKVYFGGLKETASGFRCWEILKTGGV